MNSNDPKAKKTDDPSMQDTMLGLGILLAIGFVIYWLFFGNDRAEVTRCIEAAAEADRAGAQISSQMFRRLQFSVDHADEVEIVETSTYPFASVYIKSIRFTLDGRAQSIKCPT